MKKHREEIIKEEISSKGQLSMQGYDYFLKAIAIDVYDSINKLKEWSSFSIK